MSVSFNLRDLPDEFCKLSYQDQLIVIRVATDMYYSLKDNLNKTWKDLMSAEESARRQCWVDEGRKLEKESVSDILTDNVRLSESLKQAMKTIEILRDTTTKEVERQLEYQIKFLQQEFELSKVREIAELKEQMASYEARDKLFVVVEENCASLKEKLAALEVVKEDLQKQLLAATASKTKSSYALGKEGETTVLGLLENVVMPAFPYSSIKEMSSTAHAGDFHLSVMLPHGKMGKILIESKNYQHTVDMVEINKLIRDVDSNEDVNCGMMISLESLISNTKQIQIKKTPKLKPIIYLSLQNLDNEDKNSILCGAISTLISFVGESIAYSTKTKQDEDIVQPLLHSLQDIKKEAVSAMNYHARAQSKLSILCEKIDASIKSLRKETLIETGVCDNETDIAQKKVEKPTQSANITTSDGCITKNKDTKMMCGDDIVAGFKRCYKHLTAKERAVIAGGAGRG
jgi:hypothetical protein